MITLSGDVLRRYPRVSRYNSPYPAHDAGCAVDLYPARAAERDEAAEGASGETANRAAERGEAAEGANGKERPVSRAAGDDGNRAPSPVAGTVVATRSVRCPEKPYAADRDHLIVVDTGDHVARILHVDPAVEPGDRVAVGDDLGAMVRSGFFAPWVDNHVHLGFRTHDQDPVRASGSRPPDLDVPVEPVGWDGAATVVDTGETWVRLDAPEHPAPGEAFAGLASDDGHLLDGGLPHYEFGYAGGTSSTVSLFGAVVGDRTGDRTVTWRDVVPTANGEPIRGLSLWLGLDSLGCKLVAPGHDFAVGDSVTVDVRER